MFPGGGGMDPKQLKAMMKKLGIEVEDFPDVAEITITTVDGAVYRVENPSVTKMSAQGEDTLQVQGEVVEAEEAEPKSIAEQDTTEDVELDITDEDIQIVQSQAGVDEETAREALEEVGGNPAEAIIQLKSG